MTEQDLLEECTTYLRSVFPDVPEGAGVHEVLRDGVLLSRIVHILDPEFAIKVDKRQISFVFGANIQNFISYCKSIKIPESYLPAPLSLVNNDPQAVKSVASVLWLIYKLSGLGEWPSKRGTHNFIDLDQFSDIKLDRSVLDARRLQEAREAEKNAQTARDTGDCNDSDNRRADTNSNINSEAQGKRNELEMAYEAHDASRVGAEKEKTQHTALEELYQTSQGRVHPQSYQRLYSYPYKPLKPYKQSQSYPNNRSSEQQIVYASSTAVGPQTADLHVDAVGTGILRTDNNVDGATPAELYADAGVAQSYAFTAGYAGGDGYQPYLASYIQSAQQAYSAQAAQSAQEAQTSQTAQQQTTEKVQQFKTEATDKSCYEKQNLDVIYFDEPDYKLYPTFRCDAVILGAPGCGKTTLGMRIHQGHCRFTPQEVPQFFELVYLHQADNWPANIHLVLRETEEDKYMRECNFVFLCFSFNDMRSFKALTKYFKLIEKYGDPDVILIGLKADDRIPQITYEMIQKLLDSYKKSKQNSLRYHSISALKGYGVKSLLDGLEFYMNREEEAVKK